MTKRVIVIGAGVGGLAAALQLARCNFSVRVIEARVGDITTATGGLAAGFERDGLNFDAGPYILLDRPGLQWAFQSLGLELEEHVQMRRIVDVYEVSSSNGPPVCFHADLAETAAGMERASPGSGKRYEHFVRSTEIIYRRLNPLLRVSRPGPLDLLRRRAWMHVPFLLQPLGSILARTNLPSPVINAIGIWTHVAGHSINEAPSPLAFVPALIHTIGAFYPTGGIASITQALAQTAVAAGVEFQYGTKVRAIRCERGRVHGVVTEDDGFIAADVVVSNHSGVGTYLEMLDETPPAVRKSLHKLPLQSPGACVYLAVRGGARPPYLHFHLPGHGELCRLLITPAVVAPELERDGWRPARLLAPMNYEVAEHIGVEGQREYLEQLLAEDWWHEHAGEFRVLATRVPAEWGAQFNLYRDSMNPVMTARLMRAGRLAHRSPFVRGLYLAGSSAHPGQWVSFCAISGVLAANAVIEDFS